MLGLREADVARQCVEYCEGVLGLRLFRADPGGKTRRKRPRSAGLPDYFACLPGGRWLALEIKGPDARPRTDQPEQAAVLAYLEAQGALVLRVSSLRELVAALPKRPR